MVGDLVHSADQGQLVQRHRGAQTLLERAVHDLGAIAPTILLVDLGVRLMADQHIRHRHHGAVQVEEDAVERTSGSHPLQHVAEDFIEDRARVGICR